MLPVFEIKLKSIKVIENGTLQDVEGVNLISFTLIYPREGLPALVSARSLKLKDNESFDYSIKDFQEQLIFKESIRDSAILQLELSSIAKASKFEKLLVDIFGVATKAAIGTIPGIGPIVTAVLTTTSSSIIGTAVPSDKITVIGKGYVPLREDTPDGDLSITLSIPDEIVLTKLDLDKSGNLVKTTKKLPKNFNNAQVIVNVKKIGSLIVWLDSVGLIGYYNYLTRGKKSIIRRIYIISSETEFLIYLD